MITKAINSVDKKGTALVSETFDDRTHVKKDEEMPNWYLAMLPIHAAILGICSF